MRGDSRREQPVGTEADRRGSDVVPFREAVRAWFPISLQTFGGPAGQIAVMQRELVEERRWIGQRRFLHALSYCTLLPGPEAQQLAIYVGWLLNGVRGGLVAGTLFVLPGVVGAARAVGALCGFRGHDRRRLPLFAGLAPAVLAIVAQAVVRVGKKALGHPALVALAVAAFLALTLFAVPFPAVVAGRRRRRVGAGSVGPRDHAGRAGRGGRDDGPATADPRRRSCTQERPTARHAVKVLASARSPGGSRSGRSWRLTGGTASSPSRGCSSRARLWSPSAARTPCWPTWRRRRSRSTGGSRRGRWCAAWRSPSRRPAR